MRHVLLLQRDPHTIPDLTRDRVDVRVAPDGLQQFESALGDLAARAVTTDAFEKRALLLAADDVHVVAVAVPGLVCRLDPGADTEPSQQARYVVGEPATRRGVVDPDRVPDVHVNAPVRRPEVTQEQCAL